MRARAAWEAGGHRRLTSGLRTQRMCVWDARASDSGRPGFAEWVRASAAAAMMGCQRAWTLFMMHDVRG